MFPSLVESSRCTVLDRLIFTQPINPARFSVTLGSVLPRFAWCRSFRSGKGLKQAIVIPPSTAAKAMQHRPHREGD